jgi:hypothetical protein
MLVGDLIKGQLLRPKIGEFYLYQDTWVLETKDNRIVDYRIATLHPLRAMRVTDHIETAACGVYVGKTNDAVKIVGAYTSYNLLIAGQLYKISGRELKNLECVSNIGEDTNEKDDYKN